MASIATAPLTWTAVLRVKGTERAASCGWPARRAERGSSGRRDASLLQERREVALGEISGNLGEIPGNFDVLYYRFEQSRDCWMLAQNRPQVGLEKLRHVDSGKNG